MKDLLKIFKLIIVLYLLSSLYVAIKNKGFSVELFIAGFDFFPYAFLLITCYYFYIKNSNK